MLGAFQDRASALTLVASLTEARELAQIQTLQTAGGHGDGEDEDSGDGESDEDEDEEGGDERQSEPPVPKLPFPVMWRMLLLFTGRNWKPWERTWVAQTIAADSTLHDGKKHWYKDYTDVMFMATKLQKEFGRYCTQKPLMLLR